MQLRSIALWSAVLAATAAALIVLRPTGEPPAEVRQPFVWSIKPDALRSVTIRLAREGKQITWVRDGGGNWRFDLPDGGQVDEKRWGLGIPLLLSGPRASRLITGAVEDRELPIYGLDRPRIIVTLGTADGGSLAAHIGDNTPDGSESYVRVEGTGSIYSVHRTFAEVVEGLMRNPPYLPRSRTGSEAVPKLRRRSVPQRGYRRRPRRPKDHGRATKFFASSTDIRSPSSPPPLSVIQ